MSAENGLNPKHSWSDNPMNTHCEASPICQQPSKPSPYFYGSIRENSFWMNLDLQCPPLPSMHKCNEPLFFLLSSFVWNQLPLSSFLFPAWKYRKWRSIPEWKASAPSLLTRCSWRASGIRCTPAVRKHNTVFAWAAKTWEPCPWAKPACGRTRLASRTQNAWRNELESSKLSKEKKKDHTLRNNFIRSLPFDPYISLWVPVLCLYLCTMMHHFLWQLPSFSWLPG